MKFNRFSRPAQQALAAAACTLCVAHAQAIVGGSPTTGFFAVGLGVQVTPDWVLSTYHATYGVGQVYSNGYGQRVIAQVYSAPGAFFDGSIVANDLTLFRLAPGISTAPYLAVEGQSRGDSTFGPLNVTIVSPFNPNGARGSAFSTINESVVQLDPDDAGPSGPVTENFLLSHDRLVYVEGGDSSGGLFAGHVADAAGGVLLGITSSQLQDANGVPNGSAFVQPAAYRSWIDAVMANDGADNQMVQWTTAAVPEPAAWALWGLGFAALLARRRHGAGPG